MTLFFVIYISNQKQNQGKPAFLRFPYFMKFAYGSIAHFLFLRLTYKIKERNETKH